MPTQQQLIDALDRADAAGDEAAAREIAAMISASAQPSASAPQQDEGFFDRLGREAKNAMGGNITTAKAMAQGLPGVGTWTDELAGKVITALHGGDEEQNRRDYMAPVEAMPAGRRFAAELAGGVVGSAPLGGLGVLRGLGAAMALGAASGAGAADGNESGGRLLGAGIGAGAGAVGGVLAPMVAGAASSIGNRVANAARSVMGKPTTPYIGRGGLAAQKTLRESVENSGIVGDAPPVSTMPLVAQQPAAGASAAVLAGGGKPAASLVGAAKAVSKDDAALKAAGEAYQTRLGIVPLTTATTPQDILASPTVSSNAISAVLGNKDMAPILRKIARDTAFEGVPENNLTLLHQAKAMLAERVRAAKKTGKITETAGRLGRLHKQFEDALDAAAPGYRDVSREYAEASAKRTAQKEAAKLAGSEKKFVPVEAAGPGIARLLAESVSGSIPGVQMRGAIATTAHAAQAAAKAAKGAQARKLVEILTEKDPKKIEMALRMLRKDLTGKPFRWPMMYQGPNALQAWARDEEAR